MKKLFLLLLAIGMTTISSVSMAALSNNGIRNETRFLSDKMAYELNLTNAQYNDLYEINYDFIYSINRVMDYAVKGYEWAMNDYYDALDLRNDELRYVLSNSQYRRFMRIEYFYRPIYVASSRWSFRVYNNYVNRNLFYLPKPYHYQTYKGANRRVNYSSNSYYNGRYKHDSYYTDRTSVRNDRTYQSNRRSDFGSVSVRPNTNSRPNNNKTNNATTRPSNNNNNNNVNSNRGSSSSSSTSRPSTTDKSRTESSTSTNRRSESTSSSNRKVETSNSSNRKSDSSVSNSSSSSTKSTRSSSNKNTTRRSSTSDDSSTETRRSTRR